MMKFEEFRQLAEGANLVPVVHRVLADLETPVSVLARFRDDENVFLPLLLPRHPSARRLHGGAGASLLYR